MENLNEEGKTLLRRNYYYQKLAIIIGALAWFSSGLLTSWASPFMMKISQDKENYKISEEDCLNFSIVPPIAMMITCPLFSKLCDIIGRKPVFLLSAIPQLQAWLIKAIAKDLHHFYIARTLVGIGDGILLACTPMYIGEIASPNIRGTWGIAPVLCLYVGELMITILGSYLSIEITSFVCAPLPILFVLSFSFMPESPYYLVIAGREEAAKASLRKFTGKQDIEEDYLEIKGSISRQMSEESTWKALFVINSSRRALAAGVFLRVSQMLGGATVFINYTQYIFLKSGGNVSQRCRPLSTWRYGCFSV
ncbi:facilitated trehalose transporter Tret1-like [Leptinotarsa decemlineata]|uniref:facilitated trehalose transporter Tret1-like n=1 Tax=Leptinotarsa decemlineata TaxID=7539 RepID=UPI003D308C6A